MSALPVPLTPADCDLRGLTFMPLDVLRLRDSDLALLSSGDEFKAAVLLWCASWHQTPAASLPDDDRVLFKLSGLDAKAWKRCRDGALRGWVKCDDGRIYHPVVAEKALDAWEERKGFRKRREADNQRLKDWRERKRNGGETESETGSKRDVKRVSNDDETGRTGDRGQGTGESSSEAKASGTDGAAPDLDSTAWLSAVKVLTSQGRMPEPQARRLFGKLLSTHGLEARDLLPALSGAMVNSTRDPQSYLTKSAESLAKRRSGPVKQVDWC